MEQQKKIYVPSAIKKWGQTQIFPIFTKENFVL